MDLYRLTHLGLGLAWLCAGCANLERSSGEKSKALTTAQKVIEQVKSKFAPDSHLAIYDVTVERRAGGFVLKGEVDRAEAKREIVLALKSAGIRAKDEIVLLPAQELGDKVWGIACLSVANGREEPSQKAELGTQVLMGHAVRIWKRDGRWFLAQSKDGYLAWIERGSFVPRTQAEVQSWERGPLLIITALEGQVFDSPRVTGEPVSDLVVGNLAKKTGEEGEWYEVQLPDERKGFLLKKSAEDYTRWKQSRKATPETIERTAKQFLGRPYLWGANSPKGLDCSGFSKMVFFINGIDLNRNASHQARQGTAVPLDTRMSAVKKGDLLFFGRRGRRGGESKVSHVGIYLGDNLFIQSSQRVRLSSLDPASPLYDEQYGRALIAARRVLD